MHSVIRRTVLRGFALLFLVSARCVAGSLSDTGPKSPEDFRIEVMGSAWTLNTSGYFADSATGNFSTGSTQVNLQSDLGVSQGVETFYGRLTVKPGRKHRIFVEGVPFSLTGNRTAVRTFSYAGRTYSINEQLLSKADLSYVFGGYQYDFLSGEAGHLGASVGGAYLNATGEISAPAAGVASSRSQQIGLPLAGLEGRLFPLPGHRFLDLDGGVRGMDFGSYGHYVEFDGNAGLWLGLHLALQAGYREITADLHNNSANSANNGSLHVNLGGPTFSLLFKW